MIRSSSKILKFSALFLSFSMIVGCEGREEKPDIHMSAPAKAKKSQKPKTDPFQPTIDRLVVGEKIPLEQLIKELEDRTWEQIQPLLLVSIKKRSQRPNWTKGAQKKAMAGYSKVGLLFAKRRRNQSLEELKRSIQIALKKEHFQKNL